MIIMTKADYSAKILGREIGCDRTWGGFEEAVVNGWPVDLIKISGEHFVYEPLGIDAKRIALKAGRASQGVRNGLLAWRDEAPFDMEW
jgi:hypothetical protein